MVGIPLTQTQTNPLTALLLREGFNQNPPRTGFETFGRVAAGVSGLLQQQQQQKALSDALAGFDPSNPESIRGLLASKNPQIQALAAQLLIGQSQSKAKTQAQIEAEKRGLKNKVELRRQTLPFDIARARAGRASTTIKLPAGEIEADKLGARRADKGLTEATTQGRTSLGTVQQLNAIQRLLKSLPTGPGTGTQVKIGAALAKVGIDPRSITGLDPNQIADAQTVSGLISTLAIQDIKRLGTRPTDKDMEILLQSLPDLAKLPGGNEKTIIALKEVNKRVIAKARIMRQTFKKNKGRSLQGFDEAFEAWLKKNPIKIPGVNLDVLSGQPTGVTKLPPGFTPRQ